MRLDESAGEGVGTIWKEELGQRHYDPDAGGPQSGPLPQTLLLPHGMCWPVSVSTASPFLLRRERGTLYLYLDEVRLFPVELERRPKYYNLQTATGVPMRLIGVHRLMRQVLVESNAYCRFFSQRNPCLFCGLMAERALLTPRHRRLFAASPQEVAEVVAAAYSEGSATEMQVTGGVLPEQREVDYLIEVGQALQTRLGVETVPGSQAVIAAPQRLEQVDALRAAGWEGVAFNLEIWSPALWPGIVPGKAALLPRERWLAALEHAAHVFGKGNVASVLVAGIEPKASFLEGVRYFAEHGIYGVPIPWTPAPGSAFEGHQTPTAAWHLDATVRTLDIWDEHGLSSERHSSGGLHYADLGRMREHVLREQRDSGSDLTRDLRYRLAVTGELPAELT